MSIYGGPDIVTNGLVLYLDAANSKSYPGTGTVWTDLSGNGNNGTLTNGPTYNSANKGSIVFDGTNDYIQTTYTNSSSASAAFSVGVFYYLGSSAGLGFLVGNGTESNPYDGIWFLASGGGRTNKTVLAINTTNGAFRDIHATNAKSINRWYYLVGTYSGNSLISGLKLYENGVSVSTTVNSNSGTLAALSTRQWRIGVDSNSLDWLLGNIAIVQIYNRELSASEVLQNYNALKGRYGL